MPEAVCRGHPRIEQIAGAFACVVCGNELQTLTVPQIENRYGKKHRVASERHKASQDAYPDEEPEPETDA